MRPLPSRPRTLAALVAAALATAALAIAPAGAARAQSSCLELDYSARVWTETRGGPGGEDTGGFVITFTLTNSCPSPVPGWTVGLTLPPGHTFDVGWSANWTVTGRQITATNQGWNGLLGVGRSTSFGFVGSWSGGYQDPLSCTINGVPCDREPTANQPPRVTLTSPAPGQSVVFPCPVTLTADATDPDGTIDRVEFHVDRTLVGVDRTAPYQAVLETAGSGSASSTVVARAFDDGDPPVSTDSAEATFFLVAPPPSLAVIACDSDLEVLAGSTETVRLVLSASTSVEVDLAVSGDPGISVAPESFILDGSVGGDVVVTADPGSAGATATITATAPGFSGATIAVTVTAG